MTLHYVLLCKWKYSPRQTNLGFFFCMNMPEDIMARSIDSSFYKSREWKITRAEYFKSQSGLCERCKAQGLIVPADIVHHKIHLTEANYNDPSISLNFDNLECLCIDCHNKAHFRTEDKQSRWTFNRGSLVILD